MQTVTARFDAGKARSISLPVLWRAIVETAACSLLLMPACSCSPLGTSPSEGSDTPRARQVSKMVAELFKVKVPRLPYPYYRTFTVRGPLTKAQFNTERIQSGHGMIPGSGADANSSTEMSEVTPWLGFDSRVEEGDEVYAYTGKSRDGSSIVKGYVLVHGDKIKDAFVTLF
jgi:hypothetical protein